jgi:lysophospholipase L1-like esterase
MSRPPLRHWLLGLGLSCALVWLAGALLLDTVQPVTLDPAVNRSVSLPGTVSRTRSEGFSSSHVGEHGIRGLPGGKLPPGPKVVFWGDSFVEAVQVDDSERMAQVFSSLAQASGLPLSGVGIGTGGDTLIDCIVKAPDFVPVLGPVRLHVFFLGRISDVLPDAPRPCRAAFLSHPEPHILRNDCPPTDLALRLAPTVRRLELSWAFSMYQKLRNLRLRLAPGPAVAAPKPAKQAADMDLSSLWDYLIGQTRRASSPDILFVYAPAIPAISRGQAVYEDSEAATATGFADACHRNGVGFINLGPSFTLHFRATGRLPKGFFNTPPGTGHLNEDGHRMVAEAVLKYIKEHRDALLAP